MWTSDTRAHDLFFFGLLALVTVRSSLGCTAADVDTCLRHSDCGSGRLCSDGVCVREAPAAPDDQDACIPDEAGSCATSEASASDAGTDADNEGGDAADAAEEADSADQDGEPDAADESLLEAAPEDVGAEAGADGA